MLEDSTKLRERITRLSDEELMVMVTTDRRQYRDEALDFAGAELRRRGLSAAPLEGVDAGAPRVYSETARVQALHRVTFKIFRSSFITWEELFGQAAEFANEIGPERVISISHSSDDGNGVVTVWYWT
jgi:hypothetical protein